MTNIDSTNKSAFCYSATVACQINNICTPLIKYFNIKNFGYLKIFRNSTYLHINNGFLDYQKIFFETILTQGKVFTESMKINATTSNYSYFIWSTKIINDPIISLLYAYNIWHGISIHYKTEKYIEVFSFAFDRQSNCKKNFFINNKDLLIKFSEYFKLTAKEIIDCSDKSKLAIFKLNHGLPSNFFLQTKNSQHLKKQKFLSQLTVSKLCNTKFSKREIECIKHLAHGKTAKEIASLLCLSPRTVESYIENIKSKTGYNFKSQIIDLFWSNINI